MSIPIPSGMTRGRATWTLGHTGSSIGPLAGVRGVIRFEASATAVTFADATVLPDPVETPVIGGVMTPVNLIVNDPEIWNWKVTPRVGVTWEPFHVNVPGDLNLATAAVVPGRGPVKVVSGPAGADGESAYQLAVENGYPGTREQWLASLHGQDGSNVLPDQEAVTGALGIFSANAYGASPTASWETNRDAFQAANNAAALRAEGGRVVATPGTYNVAGIRQDARVEFYLPAVTLRHPTGEGADIIRARTHSTTGSITKGTPHLQVASTAGIEVGAVIGVRAADSYSSVQWTTLPNNITTNQTAGITLASSVGYAQSGYLVVEDEVIHYTGMTGTTLTGVTRGVYGTTALDHLAGARIGTAARLVAEVVAIAGNVITLDRPAKFTVTSAPVLAGILAPKVTGVHLHGNRKQGITTATQALRWELVRYGTIRDLSVTRGESALFFSQGTRDCRVTGLTAHDCSVPEASLSSVVWLFQHCHRNTLNDLMVTGDMWTGVYLDNRTVLSTEWDGPCDGNTGSNWLFSVTPHSPRITNAALNIIASSQNTFSHITMNHVRTGLLIAEDDQSYTGDGSHPRAWGNHVDTVKMFDGHQPYVLYASGNAITGLTYEGSLFGIDTGENLVALSGTGPGINPSLGSFADGAQASPGIAFGSERNTGFWRIAAGQWQWVSGAQMVVRLRPGGILMAGGTSIDGDTTTGFRIGSGSTVKLGFWGATPIARPGQIADTSGVTVTALEAEVNKLKALLRDIGVMAR